MSGGRPPVDLTGRTFGDWTVLAYSHKDDHTHWWRVQCACGAERAQRQWVLTDGKSKRCGSCGARTGRQTLSRNQAEEWVGTECNGWVLIARAEVVPYGTGKVVMWTCRCLTCGAVVDFPRTVVHKPIMPVCHHGVSPVTEE